jgi:signal peptidase II
MMKKPWFQRGPGLRWLWLSVLIIVLDQVSKEHFLATVPVHGRIPVIDGFFDWTLTFNEGVAFSLFGSGGELQRLLLSSFAVLVSSVFVIWMGRLPKSDRLSAISLALIVGGAIGNVIDRIIHGHVIDFVLLYWREWHWPAFNLADSAIVCGAILMVIAGFLGEGESRPERSPA